MEYCPQCGADLECFGLLHNLQESGNTGYVKQGSFTVSPKIKWFMLTLLLSGLLLGLVAGGSYLDTRMDQLTVRLSEVESLSRHQKSIPKLAQHVTTMEQQIKKLEEDNFQKRIDDLDQRRTVAWRRIKAALATYGTSVDLGSRP
nr:MAG: hypothetical protein BECKTUN1418D_GA0071000_10259 [Candidatus Kentron sp. TUN]